MSEERARSWAYRGILRPTPDGSISTLVRLLTWNPAFLKDLQTEVLPEPWQPSIQRTISIGFGSGSIG